MPTILRHERLAFMEIETKFELLGEGVTDWSISANAKTGEKHYVHQKNSSAGLTGYAPTISITAEGYSGDPFMDYIMDLGRTLSIGEKANVAICIVDTWKQTASECSATKQNVVISIDNPGSGAGGEALSVSATLTYTGDPVEGMFNLSTKTFTVASTSSVKTK